MAAARWTSRKQICKQANTALVSSILANCISKAALLMLTPVLEQQVFNYATDTENYSSLAVRLMLGMEKILILLHSQE